MLHYYYDIQDGYIYCFLAGFALFKVLDEGALKDVDELGERFDQSLESTKKMYLRPPLFPSPSLVK